MGVFSDILDAFTGAAGLGYSIYKDQHLTGAELESNAFSAHQASENRAFQSAEAQRARDWQEQQYLRHNSPAAMMEQYRAAGLNPALMYQQGTAPASMSTSAPSGDSAASINPKGGDVVGMIGALMQLSKLSEEKRGLEISNDSAEFELGLRKQYGAMFEKARVGQLEAAAKLATEQAKSEEQRRALMTAQKILAEQQGNNLSLEAFEQKWRNAYIKDSGASPDRDAITQLLQGTVTAIAKALTGIFPNSFTLNLNSLELPPSR